MWEGSRFLRNQNELAVYSIRRLELWDTTTWERIRVLTNYSRIIYPLDPRVVWLELEQRSAGLFDAQTLEPRLVLPTGMLPVALSKDGRHVAMKVDSHRLQVWNLTEIRNQLRELGLDWGEK
jgi:hypothetical protein